MIKPSISRLIRQTPLRWILPNKVMRLEVIQCAINMLRATRYLEIGVADGECFCALSAPEKLGVDPICPMELVALEVQKPGVSYFALTSDDFFEHAAPQALRRGVDVVFIDGLHTFTQAYRDCVNALNYLNPAGVIFLHDCLPTSEEEARAAETYDAARKLHGPSWNGLWTGDVWKAIVKLRSQHADLQAHTLNCDHGIGMVFRTENDSGLGFSDSEIEAMTYSDLSQHMTNLLGLRRPGHLLRVLKMLRGNHA